ncbi:MAG: hypothetical protein BWY87_01017 [Deltaproteobacteria bacterium ADurb.Bin510]|nr:MAG: hypothetical protein BWY87_01017 [Deltaproteobacteria bacterium ADurb.Bin510]
MPEIELERNQVLRLKPGRYQVHNGCLWLTVGGQDLILEAGARCRLQGSALAQALSATRLSLSPASGSLLRLSLRAG